MKKITRLIQYFSFGILITGLSVLPQTAASQTGANDATFNTADNKSAAGADWSVYLSLVQPDNKTLIVGGFSRYNNQKVNDIVRLNLDGQPDPEFTSGTGTNGWISTLALQFNNKIVIAGHFTNYNGTAINNIARLNKNGKLDKSFKPGTGTNDEILSIAIQPNGKIVAGGKFTTYDDTPVNQLVRLNSNGTIDEDFNLSDSLGDIRTVTLQPDGKIIVSVNDPRHGEYLIRLNRNGSRDHTFSYPEFHPWSYPRIETVVMQGEKILVGGGISSGIETREGLLLRLNPTGEMDTTFENSKQFDVWIKSLALQQDGKIMITGRYAIYADDNISSNYIGRLNASGTKDSTFKVHKEERDYGIASNTISIQTDGKIIVGGNFSTVGDLLVNNIVRLNNNGEFDLTFNQKTGANGSILSSVNQSDGAILIGGRFSSYNYQLANHIARLKKDGSLDPSFKTGVGPNGPVHAIAVQSNGKIILGGEFTSYNNEPSNHLVRLNKNGEIDKNFNNASVDGTVYSIALQQNGKIIIGGDFEQVNGSAIRNVARLHANGVVDQGFSSPLSDESISVVYVCKIQENGKLLIGGRFEGTYPSGVKYRHLIRLNNNGNPDTDFKGNVPERIYAIALQPDNKILVGGGRGTIEYQNHIDPFRGYIARLNVDGTDDSSFESPFKNPSGDIGNSIRTITVLKNGKVLFGGLFSPYESPILNHIGLLNENGTVDSSFTANANSNVFTSTLVNKNKLIIAGDFTLYNSIVRTGIARISVASESLSYGNSIAENEAALTSAPSIVLFPNPASADITVNNLSSGSKLTIRNALGELMEARVSNNQTAVIELGNYANGIYFLTADSNGTISNFKFIVNK